METAKLVEMLRATTDPAARENAETQLKQVEKIIGVAPALLQIVMTNDIDMPVRQAAVIYLKGMISNSWSETEEDPSVFHIHEQDRATIRDSLVDAVVHAPSLIRSQLCVCISFICRRDFPGRWTSLVDKLCIYLQSPEVGGWLGALAALLSLVKVFEYRKGKERAPLDEAMNLLLPLVQDIITRLINDTSLPSLVMQRHVLKIFHALTQHHLPLNLLGEKGQWLRFQGWMEVVRQVLDRNNPEFEKRPSEDGDIDRDELEQNEWWKTKKWAIRILYRMFERYGSPGGVSKEYKNFSVFFLNTFSQGALHVVFKILDSYRQRNFVAEKVLRDCLMYLKNAVSHAHTWKLMKPHAEPLISDVIYPLLCHSEEDERLWKEDPIEYIRLKYDSIEEDDSVGCAEKLLNSMCKKRKGMLPKVLHLVTVILNNPSSDARQKDGALHLVGSITDILLRKDQYKDQFDDVLIRFVFPSISCHHPHLRARAAWLLSKLSTMSFSRDELLQETIRVLITAILTEEEEMPVKVEAAFALEQFMQDQYRTHVWIEPYVTPLCIRILEILRSTENDDLTSVLQKMVCQFAEKVAPIAIDICNNLVQTFLQVVKSSSDDGEKTIVAMGLLSTMETILVVMEDQPGVCSNLEPVLLQVVSTILDKTIMEFYEEAFSIIASLTEKQVTPQMWQAYEAIYRCVERDGVEYFMEMMPALHNYITVDTNAFLMDRNRLVAMCTIVKNVLAENSDIFGEETECHAAKLIEVLILQCRHKIQDFIPNLLHIVSERMTREIKTTELRTMCLQVVVASLFHDVNLTLSVLTSVDSFVEQWMSDIDCFLGLHDRRICVLGLCTLLQNQPKTLQDYSSKILPSMILLFDGLKRAYAAKAAENADSESEDDDKEEYCEIEEVLGSDEDEIDEEAAEYLENLERKIKSSNGPFKIDSAITADGDDDDYDDDDDDSIGESTALECYETPLDSENCDVDEYVMFKTVMLQLQMKDPQWYNLLTKSLNEQQGKCVQEIFTLADQRKAAAESREILKSGGFKFVPQAVPTSFNFGAGLPSM